MEPSTWLEVSLTVNGELAEAVAEVLARYAPNESVVIESTAVTANADDTEGHAIGPLRVYAFLPTDEKLEETRQKLEEALWYLGRIQPLPPAEYRIIQDTDWAAAWKQHYHPIAIGSRLMIVPAWLESPSQDRVSVRIDPGMAFGTGTHPTTQLCLEVIEKYVQTGEPVLDVGCGTAILAVAALKLGADRALGVDIDREAIKAARENAANNEVSDRLELGLGSVGEILQGQFSLTQAPLVLANILAPVLIRLFDDGLAELVSPGGVLVLSGIIDTQAPEVQAAGERKGLKLVDHRQITDWVALVMQR